jgi:hypothetical protein
VHALIKVVTGLAIAAEDVLGDVPAQEVACLVQERLVVVG